MPTPPAASLASQFVGLQAAGRGTETVDISAILEAGNPLDKVEAGLICNGALVPLQGVHVFAKLVDLASQVVVIQRYQNPNDYQVEAKYVFPLDDSAAVCGFEAFINEKHVVGKCKEKEVARREYKEAVAAGKGAYLMETETPDVFTVSIGNLPPRAIVLIKIIYVAELKIEAGEVLHAFPILGCSVRIPPI